MWVLADIMANDRPENIPGLKQVRFLLPDFVQCGRETLYILVNSKHVLDRTKKLCLLIGVLSWKLLGTADTGKLQSKLIFASVKRHSNQEEKKCLLLLKAIF